MLALLAKTDYPFLDIMWTRFIFFAWLIWISLLVMVLADNFRRAATKAAGRRRDGRSSSSSSRSSASWST